ncbi:hypothetical protein [Photorhabdus heterorhabditis]|uniref:hypothetical protein n=1 Tax=Photorhabdus heterorhabditis TaxID=880156 RepID=UPI000B2E51B9|nr:hypothetical protein [Photorhabdus heterorhabditis]
MNSITLSFTLSGFKIKIPEKEWQVNLNINLSKMEKLNAVQETENYQFYKSYSMKVVH